MVINRIKSKFIGLLLAGSLTFCQSQTLFSAKKTLKNTITTNLLTTNLSTLVDIQNLAYKYDKKNSSNPLLNVSIQGITALALFNCLNNIIGKNELCSSKARFSKYIASKYIASEILKSSPFSFAFAEKLAKMTGLEKTDPKNTENKIKTVIKGIVINKITGHIGNYLLKKLINDSWYHPQSDWGAYLGYKVVLGLGYAAAYGSSALLSLGLVESSCYLGEIIATKTCSAAYSATKTAFNAVTDNSIVNNPVTKRPITIVKKAAGLVKTIASGLWSLVPGRSWLPSCGSKKETTPAPTRGLGKTQPK